MLILISILSGIIFVYSTSGLIDEVNCKISKPDIEMTTYDLVNDFKFMQEKKA